MLDKIDLSQKMSLDDSIKELAPLQLKLLRLQQKVLSQGAQVIIMYEGWDAAGKGGNIRRITEKLDARNIRVWPIAAPDEIERRHNYLWRFWTRTPAKGEITIFDRSWYGRVLVERVEGFATPEEWKRAYNEICNFEKILVDNGIILIKFWMQISKEEQLQRFKDREKDPYKQWKITDDDWRNREKWDEYKEAAEDIFKFTDTDCAPWTIVPAECKRFARVFTAKKVVHVLEKALGPVSIDDFKEPKHPDDSD